MQCRAGVWRTASAWRQLTIGRCEPTIRRPPRAAGRASPREVAAELEPAITHEILIVDASEALRSALAEAAPGLDLRLHEVHGLEAALAAAVVSSADLILIDAGAAPADGFERCRRLHEVVASAQIPLILIGRFEMPDDFVSARECGAADLIATPTESVPLPTLLLARLEPHLAAARARTDLQHERRARLRAEAEAHAAQRARSDLLASMGHEIRTPMTAILGMSHLVLQSGLNPRQRNYVEKVERSAEMLLGTLNDILDFSRLDAGTLELQRAPFKTADLLGSLARLVGTKAEEKGLELLFEVPRELPSTLIGDSARLIRVLANLGDEAVRASALGEIVIGIELVERESARVVLRFSVRDTGSALRPDPATQSAELGTRVRHELLRLMGAETIVSPQPTPGHVVHFAVGFELGPDADQAPLAEGLSRAPRALVVDDNATARRIMAGMAAELGLQTDAARDGWDALRLVTQAQRVGRPYEIVLLDWKMPGMDGVECARHLAAGAAPVPAILMIAAFGQHDALQRLQAHRIAVQGVLAKPVTPAALRDAVSAALQGAPAEGLAGPEHSLDAHRAKLRGARILLVEDNAIIQELALDLLTGAGMIVSVAENGREALARLAKQGFDGVLMDCQMPVLDGYETTRALRALPQFERLPVIALTANALDGERERVLAAGMNDHVAKPLDVALLFEALARWVRPVPASEPGARPPPSPPGDDPFTRLPGIDARVGRNSTMNNDKLYRRLLGMFLDGQRDFALQFRAARSAGDGATAMRLAHNLRAVSASLGALAVQQSSGALERACADKAPDAEIARQLAQVELDLTPVLAGLGALGR